jgi:hypothetical protein
MLPHLQDNFPYGKVDMEGVEGQICLFLEMKFYKNGRN